MPGVIRLGDSTNSGGQVITATGTMIVDGKPVACLGDMVSCTMTGHPPTSPIIEGESSITDQGKPVALDGHKAACGCQLMSSVTNVDVA